MGIVCIIGGGNFFRGVEGEKNGIDRATADYIGMLATVQNALVLRDYFESRKIETRVLSAIAMPQVSESYIPSEDGQITGSKEHSNALIKLDHPLELFQIGFRAFGKNASQIPGIGNIPILGHLFKSKSDRTTYKKISALIELTQNEI